MKAPKQQSIPDNFYQTYRWKKLREYSKQLARRETVTLIQNLMLNGMRDQYQEIINSKAPHCVKCWEEYRTLEPAQECDHITEIVDGGQLYDPKNLQWMCKSHHQAKSSIAVQRRHRGRV